MFFSFCLHKFKNQKLKHVLTLRFVTYTIKKYGVLPIPSYLPLVAPHPVATHILPGDTSTSGRHTGATSRQNEILLFSLIRAMSLLTGLPISYRGCTKYCSTSNTDLVTSDLERLCWPTTTRSRDTSVRTRLDPSLAVL